VGKPAQPDSEEFQQHCSDFAISELMLLAMITAIAGLASGYVCDSGQQKASVDKVAGTSPDIKNYSECPNRTVQTSPMR
jgi:hypothetical protein